MYTSRTQLYCVEQVGGQLDGGGGVPASTVYPDAGPGMIPLSVAASCKDPADLPLTGSCSEDSWDGERQNINAPINWPTLGVPAQWGCSWLYDSGSKPQEPAGTARICCIYYRHN
jgi:hypothetical protein